MINLCEILKGHEGEKFYYLLTGKYVVLEEIEGNKLFLEGLPISERILNEEGALYERGETLLFPDNDQRDWLRWDIDHNYHDTPKTWDALMKSDVIPAEEKTILDKSSSAYLKILQLIEYGYGGIITPEDWKKKQVRWLISWNYIDNEPLPVLAMNHSYTPLTFHHERWVDEFLKYPENLQLLKEYFMV